jgi:hypothetical protein
MTAVSVNPLLSRIAGVAFRDGVEDRISACRTFDPGNRS